MRLIINKQGHVKLFKKDIRISQWQNDLRIQLFFNVDYSFGLDVNINFPKIIHNIAIGSKATAMNGTFEAPSIAIGRCAIAENGKINIAPGSYVESGIKLGEYVF